MAYRVLNASLFSTYHHGLGISQILNENIRLVKHKDALESATLSKRMNTKRKLQSENATEIERVPFFNLNTQTEDLFRVQTVSNLTQIEEPIPDNYRQTDALMPRPRTAHPRRSRTSIEDSLSLSSSKSVEDLTVDRWGRPITQNVTKNDSFQSGKSEKGSTDVQEKIENMSLDFGGNVNK